MHYFFKIILLLNGFIFEATSSYAQKENEPDFDSSYINSYDKLITTRFYFSQKQTDFTIAGNKENNDLKYKPNTSLNMGLGATYRGLTLNIALGFPFLNKDEEKGKTKYLDLQSHLYGSKWNVDVLAQFYKGFYINNNMGQAAFDKYYQRPDVRVSIGGAAVYRIQNNRKFSFKAAFIQNEWQQKSAGTLLYGGEIFYGVVRGDSALVPKSIASKYEHAGINKIHFMNFGQAIGYAYTLVVAKHFFVMGSATANLHAGFVREYNSNEMASKWSVNPNLIYRASAGYNSSVWAFNIFWVANQIRFKGNAAADSYVSNTGNIRLQLTKRLMPGPKTKKRMIPIDRFLDRNK
ncbi:MAG: DUF4421 domain-containing protein [Ferruginibacter sp.]